MTATEERPSGEATRPHDGRSVGLALERVLRQYRGLVLHVSHGHGLDPADVDLILQEVRIRLWRAHPSSETLGRVGSSYVYRTAVSAALDILRRRRAARTGVEALSGLSDGLASGAAGPAQQLEARELEERVYATVERLPEARRAVVRMYLAGYGRKEIASALQWDDTRVRNMLHRGLLELRSLLADQGIVPSEVAG